jgi:hypothetical protein
LWPRVNLTYNGDAKATQQKGDVDIYSVSTVLNELLKHARCPSALSAQRWMRPSGCFSFSLRISSRQIKDHDNHHFLQIIARGGADATLFVTTCITQVSSNRFHQRSLRNGWRFLMMILRIRMWIHMSEKLGQVR